MKKQHQNPTNQQPLLKPLKLETIDPFEKVDEFQLKRDADMTNLIDVLKDTTVEVVRLQQLVVALREEVWNLKIKVDDQSNLRSVMVNILSIVEELQNRIQPPEETIRG